VPPFAWNRSRKVEPDAADDRVRTFASQRDAHKLTHFSLVFPSKRRWIKPK
jgi:hypothetical protein